MNNTLNILDMILWKKLKKWATIWLLAPSKKFNHEKKFELDNFISYIESIWLNVKFSRNFYSQYPFSNAAWTPEERANDINEMFEDNDVEALWFLQWWELANQTLPLINFESIKKNPKIIIWKSDVDVLLNAINTKTWLIGFHACDSKIWSDKELDFQYTKESFMDRLFDHSKEVKPSWTEDWECLKEWIIKWKTVWCNLTSILKLSWTEYFPRFENKILFIETYCDNPSALLHKLTQMQQLRIFNKVVWIVVWSHFWFEQENYTATEVITDFMKSYDFPILKINEFGHYQPHMFLPIWVTIELDASNKKLEIIDDFLA